MARVWMPLPDADFDVTEVAVPWRLLTEAGHVLRFFTEAGAVPACDPLLLAGVLFGQLGAEPEPIAFYRALERDAAFRAPGSWLDMDELDFDAMLLPGGHAPGMKQYLGSEALHARIARFFLSGRPVGAICHGVLPVARALDPQTGQSVLHGYRTTCLPAWMERAAYWLTAWKHGRYYRTYEAYVQEEVVAALASPGDFERGGWDLARGTRGEHGPAFVVEDRHYVSARWPGDAYLFAERFIGMLGRG